MLTKKVYDIIKGGLTDGVYKNLRLIKKIDNGISEVVVTWARIGKPNESLRRFEHIYLLLNKKLGPGNYVIECRTGDTKGSITDSFSVTIKEPLQVQITGPAKEDLKDEIIDKTIDQETMHTVDWDDYIRLIKENESLKAQNALLLTQIEMSNKAPQTLNDAPQTTTDRILSSLNDNLPTVLGIFDKFMTQRDKQIELENRKLDLKEGKPIIKNNNSMNVEQLVRELEGLYDTDPERFEKILDELELKDPKLYAVVCEKLGLLEDVEDFEEDYEDTESE